MTAPRQLLRALHTTARAAQSSTSLAPASGLTTLPAGIKEFTPKGSAIPLRPKRTTRVTLPSGYPEPPSYPPPEEYFKELDEIDAKGEKPRRHPLWAFFHVPATQTGRPDGTPPANLGSVDLMEEEEEGLVSGRSWTAAELRLKSFEDLHVLWYVLLRERNVLATQREERRRLGIVAAYGGELITKRVQRCRKSMARIKYVLNERRLAIIAAGASSLPAPEGVSVPFTLPGKNDPLAAVEALAGLTPVPDSVGLTEGNRRKLTAPESLFEGEEDEFDAEVAREEKEEKEGKEKEGKEGEGEVKVGDK